MRYLILFLMAFGVAAQIPGTFRVTGPVAPPATNSNFGATDTIYGKGGHVTGLSSLSQAQDTLRYPLARRQLGMHFSLTDGTTYQLQSSLTNFVNVTPIYTNAGVGYNIQLLGNTVLDVATATQITADALIAAYDGVAAPDNYTMPKSWIETRSTAVDAYLTNTLARPVLSVADGQGVERDAIVLAGEWPGLWVYCPLDLATTNGANIRYPDSTTTNTTQGRWEFVSSTKTTKTVPTISDLLSADPRELASEYVGTNTSFNVLVNVSGYYAPGDGGGGLYVFTDSLSGTNALGGKIAVSGGSWQLLDRPINVRQFGARGTSLTDGTSIYYDAGDDAPGIQAAIDFLMVQPWPGGAVHIPAGGYNIKQEILVQRYDVALARLGVTQSDTNLIYWDDYPRLDIYGDGIATTLMSATTNTIWSIKGKTNYDGYNNRIQCVTLRDMDLFQQLRVPGCTMIDLFNAGAIKFERIRTRRGYIALKAAALSETMVYACQFISSAWGVWFDYDASVGGGDVGGVDFIGCNVMGQTKACLAAHYWRDITINGGFWGTRDPAVATFWFSGLSPIACGKFAIKNLSAETTQNSFVPIVMIGAVGTEGVYSEPVYPLNTYTNTQTSFRAINLENNNFSYGSTNNPVLLRSSNLNILGGVTVDKCWFDTSYTRNLFVVEQDVPDSVVIRFGDGNVPVSLLTRTLDYRTNFLTSITDANAGNLLNSGWRTMDKGGNIWTGPQAPVTVIESLVGPFGVELTGGVERNTQLPINAGASPITLKSNTPIVVDYAVKWNQTNVSPHLSVRLLDRVAPLYYDFATIGSLGQYATYTNTHGIWYRYIASVQLPAGAQCDRIVFNNFGATNDTVVLGYLSIYAAEPNLFGDNSSVSPGGASIWAGKYELGHQQWTITSAAGNSIARKWSEGWAVREAFSAISTYARGTCITSAGNVYLATTAISSGGAAPTHGSGTTGGWAFVATGSAAADQIAIVRSNVEGGITTVNSLQTGLSLSPYTRQMFRSLGNASANDGGSSTFSWIASYSGTTNALGTAKYDGAAYAVSGGAWVQNDNGMVNNRQFAITGGSQTNTIGFPLRVLGQTYVGTSGSPDLSAALEVNVTTGGVLFPRLTETQRDAITTPADGLVLYNTTSGKLQVRSGGSWVDLH